jgi:hypothetical protein
MIPYPNLYGPFILIICLALSKTKKNKLKEITTTRETVIMKKPTRRTWAMTRENEGYDDGEKEYVHRHEKGGGGCTVANNAF